MTKYNASDRFTISSKSISLSYIHAGVFVPVIGAAIKEFTITAASNPSLRLAYWDENAYVSELAVSDAPPTSASKESKGEGKKSAALPDQEGLAGTVSEDSKSKKRKAETEKPGDKKKMMPSHLQFWSDRHAELHGSSGAKLNDQKASAQDKPQQRKSQSSPVTDDPEAPSQSYADPDKHCCYLCSRQFKSATEVNKHERLSQLHRDNLKSEDLKAKAIEKLEKAGIAVLSTSAETASEYHDRAKERRQAHNQPKKPANTSSKNPAKPKPTSSEPDEPAPTPSKGASLLGKMGWSAGEGLGSQGTGMTAPIATDLYTPGVGLGAAGGKMGDATEEAARSTKGDYKEFLQKTKDRAKERYENM